MTGKGITRSEARAEISRLLHRLAWAKTKEGLALAIDDYSVGDIAYFRGSMLEDLLTDAIEHGRNPALELVNAVIRVRGQSTSDEVREQLAQAFGGLTRLLDLDPPRELRG